MSKNGSCESLIIAGFGGQGIILAGKVVAQAAMVSGREVTYMPSYGAEVRGGTANCMVIIAEESIASPMVINPDTLIAMNNASYHKFAPRIKPGGLLVLNSSKVPDKPQRDDIEVLAIPVDDIAIELNNPRSANMVALGAYLQKRGLIDPETAASCLENVLAPRHHQTIPANQQAIRRGAEFVKTVLA